MSGEPLKLGTLMRVICGGCDGGGDDCDSGGDGCDDDCDGGGSSFGCSGEGSCCEDDGCGDGGCNGGGCGDGGASNEINEYSDGSDVSGGSSDKALREVK